MQKSFTRLLLLLTLIFFSLQVSAQILLKEDFESAKVPLPPAGWSTPYTGNANWRSLDGNSYEGLQCMFLDRSYYGDQADAWLISPGFSLSEGKRYSISFYYKNQVNNRNTLQVTLGNDTTAASQTEVLETTTFNSALYTKMQINYTAKTSGNKHLGIHCITPITYTYVYVDYVVVEEVSCFEPLNVTVDINSITTSTANASWKASAGTTFEYGVSTDTIPPGEVVATTDNSIALNNLQTATRYYLFVRSSCGATEKSNWQIKEFTTAYDTAVAESLECGTIIKQNFVANTGLYNNSFCEQEGYSLEFFHKFTPTATGYYNLNILEVNTGQSVIFAYKEAGEGIGLGGWTCIGASGAGSKYAFGPLMAGKEYYIIEKAVRSVGFPSSFKFSVDCYSQPPVNDDCSNAIEIVATTYNTACNGTKLTTVGATKQELKGGYKTCGVSFEDDDIWVKFKATGDAQLFRFTDMVYTNPYQSILRPGIYFNIYSKQCDLSSIVDCGWIDIRQGKPKEIYSYLLKKDSTYYIRMFTGDLLSYATFNMCIMDLDVSKGIANACQQGLPFTINRDFGNYNTQKWVPLTNDKFKLIAQVNANTNALNEVSSGLFINSGSVRSVGGTYYLDRNFTLQSTGTPTKKMAVRLYISNNELERLIAQPGSGVSSIKDLYITQNSDNCAANFTGAATKFIKQIESGDYGPDYKYIMFYTDHLSSFYLHGGNKPLSVSASITAVSADAMKQNVKATVYPNPFTNSFLITINEKQNTQVAVTVIDMQGNILKAVNRNIDAGQTQIMIPASELAKGLYTLKIQKSNGVEYIKVIKQ